MPPFENFRFGGGPDTTVLHPVVLVAMLLTIALVFVLPRRYVIVPLVASTFLIPLGQEVLISGLHFFVYRIIILALVARMVVTKFSEAEGIFGGRLDRLDLLFFLWAILRATAVVLLFRAGGAVINQAAFLLDVIGGYFIARFLIRDEEDIYLTVKTLAVVAIIIAISMSYERVHGINPFGLLGGTRLESDVRGATVRAEGPFQQEILAGTWGAVLVPLCFLLWKMNKGRILAVLAFIACTIIAFTSSSSTPLLAYAGGIAALGLFPLRKRMRLVRWATVGLITALSLAMKAPVWFLIARIDLVGGSSGYHRAMLVNDFIFHFKDWWLVGTKDNPTWGASLWDLCNQFVAEGETGGLATFIVFIAIIYLAFSRIGRARQAVEGDRGKEWYFWILGCGIWAHMVAFFGISYFDQTRFLWFLSLAMVAAATAPYLVAATQPVTPRQPFGKPVLKPWRRPLTPEPGAIATEVTPQPKPQPAFRQRLHWRPRTS